MDVRKPRVKEWCFWTVMLEKTFESPFDCKEIKPVNPKGNQSWILIGRTDVEAETPILWPPDTKNWLLGKDPDAGKDWRQGEKGTTEDEVVRWHHQLYGHEFQQAPGVGNGQGSLVCYSPWGCKELDMTEWLNWAELNWTSRRAKQSILNEINPEYSLEGLTLKLQSFGHLMWRADSLEKTLLLGKIEGRGRMSLSKLQEIVKDREGWHAAVHRVTKSQTQLREWTKACLPWALPGDIVSTFQDL